MQNSAQDDREELTTQRPQTRLLDPYTAEARRAMVTCSKVEAYLMSRTEDVSVQPVKVPTLPCGNLQRRKFKKSIMIHIDQKMKVEVHGLLGSGAFAHVFSVLVKNCNLVNKCMAMKVSEAARYHAHVVWRPAKYEKNRSYLPWEFYITNIARERLILHHNYAAKDITIPRFDRLNLYSVRSCIPCLLQILRRSWLDAVRQNGSMLLMEKGSLGTLHDLLNTYKKVSSFDASCHVELAYDIPVQGRKIISGANRSVLRDQDVVLNWTTSCGTYSPWRRKARQLADHAWWVWLRFSMCAHVRARFRNIQSRRLASDWFRKIHWSIPLFRWNCFCWWLPC